MPRNLKDIIAHIRAVNTDPSIKTTLIQTDDLEALCAAADPDRRAYSSIVEDWLTPKPHWKVQAFHYYAAHFLVGAQLVGGDLEGNIRGLAAAFLKQYEVGVQHGRDAPGDCATPINLSPGEGKGEGS